MVLKKEATQSFAVSQEEKNAVEVLAMAARVKPATFARHMFYRGVYQYLRDHELHAPDMEEQIYFAVARLIDDTPALAQLRDVVEMRRGLEGRPPEEFGTPPQEKGKRSVPGPKRVADPLPDESDKRDSGAGLRSSKSGHK